MITLDEKTIGIWYMVTIKDHQDLLMAITEVEPDSKYTIDYRFRYYKDNKLFFDSEDIKHWYHFEAKTTKADVLDKARHILNAQKEMGAEGQLYEVINEGDFEAFIEKFQNMPFAHSHKASPEDFQKLGLDKEGRTN